MKNTKTGLITGALALTCGLIAGAAQEQKKQMASPPAETSVTIGGKQIKIGYHAPSMRGRKIFGGLVPYGEVWRAGANDATALHTEADLDIAGLSVPKGDYTIYVLPEEKGWRLIVNKQTGQWGTVYNQSQDLGRVPMTLSKTAAPVETYKMTLASAGGNKGTLTLEWENTRATVPFAAK
jgi:hypothetical protein